MPGTLKLLTCENLFDDVKSYPFDSMEHPSDFKLVVLETTLVTSSTCGACLEVVSKCE